MEPARKTTHRRDSVATRARIEKEALRLFAEKGVAGATIKDIALSEEIRAIGARAEPFAATARALVKLLCELFDGAPDVFSFILLNQHAHLRYVGRRGNAVEELRVIMARAFARGEIAIGDPDLAAAVALGAALQPAVFKLYGRLPGPLTDHAEALAVAAIRAVGAA